jgi:nitrogen-specific signal transduction histidine kinase/CheY-like chemotaxis protein
LVHLPFKGRKLLRQSFIDISERVALQNQLHQAEKMQAIGQLAGGIAHDFNNQLSSILGHAEMLQRRLTDQRLLRYVELICTAAKRSAELTQQLLDFSRKGQHLTLTTAINPLLHEVVAVLKRSVDKRITIECCFNAGEVKVKADPTQLQNALLNLALNARDAMPDGGELTFFTDIVPLGKEFSKRHSYKVTPGTYLKICVSDTGCGMSKAVQKRIFEPFFTTKAMGKGTGMGLASVYGTVLSHKGHINVYSEMGKGTTFHIYLPLALDQEAAPVQDIPLLPIAGTGHILVVDDEDLVRQMTVEMLEDLGYRVTEATHGAEALKIYQSSWQQFDLVILDMIMPAMDGRDTFIAMREINPNINAILCSGYTVNNNAESLLKLGFGAFVGKPFSSIELSHKIAELLNPTRGGTAPMSLPSA